MDVPAPGRRHPLPLRTNRPAPGEAIEIAEGVLWLRLPLPMALDHVNVYALDDGDGWTLVDTGLDTSARPARSGRRSWPDRWHGKPVRRVVVTHHHPDHVGLAGWFQAARGGAADDPHRLAFRADADARRTGPCRRPRRWPSGARAGMDPTLLESAPRNGRSTLPMSSRRCRSGFTRIAEGERSASGGRDWEVRIGHGHAPEHATLWSRTTIW